jgi:hypothetical protein
LLQTVRVDEEVINRAHTWSPTTQRRSIAVITVITVNAVDTRFRQGKLTKEIYVICDTCIKTIKMQQVDGTWKVAYRLCI